jgi:hypothetical protein
MRNREPIVGSDFRSSRSPIAEVIVPLIHPWRMRSWPDKLHGFAHRSVKYFYYSHKYGTMRSMRTTVDIPDPVYRRLKSRAASEGRPAKELILRGVELILKKGPRKSGRRVKLPLIRSKEPGTLELDNARIYEIISFP